MVKVIYGEKGTGKTKIIVEKANKLAEEGQDIIVFLDYNNRLMYDLKRNVRYTNVSDFPINGQDGFIGMLCGIISQNYDIKYIFIDGLNRMLKQDAGEMKGLFDVIKDLSNKNRIDFFIALSGKTEEMPQFLLEYVDK
jgi:hypothetical protein